MLVSLRVHPEGVGSVIPPVEIVNLTNICNNLETVQDRM